MVNFMTFAENYDMCWKFQ